MKWRLLLSGALLLLIVWQLDAGRVLAQFASIHPGWLLLALALTQLQAWLSAWRWRYTAQRLGLRLPVMQAVREYYLALFLNQVLPGGVLGDVSRAWRHARAESRAGAAVCAVVVERTSGQLLIVLAVPLCLLAHPTLLVHIQLPLYGLAALAVVVGLAGLLAVARRSVWSARLRPWWNDIRRSLFSAQALPVQLLLSTAVLTCYVLIFWAVARGLGDTTAAIELMPLVPLLLLAMLVPISFAGWGVREGAAAALWVLAGLAPAAGVAASIGYGVVVLCGSVPGAMVLWSRSNRYKRSSPSEN